MIKKFHVLYVGQIELDNVGLDGTPANDRRYSDERLRKAFFTARDVAQIMDELGFDVLWIAEHHFQREGYEVFPNLIQLGLWLATQTKRLKFGCAFNVLPMWHPIRHGRGLRHGRHRHRWPHRHGRRPRLSHPRSRDLRRPLLDAEKNRELFEEQLRLLLTCFNEQSFHFKGKYYEAPPPVDYRGYRLKDITMVPRPKHLPVEIWMPIASGKTIEHDGAIRAQGDGDAQRRKNPRRRDPRLSRRLPQARPQQALGEDMIWGAGVYLADSQRGSDPAARAGTRRALQVVRAVRLRALRRRARPHLGHAGRAVRTPLLKDGVAQKAWFCGTPAEVIDGIKSVEAKYPGLEHFMIHWAEGLSPKEFKDQLRWFAKDVMPAFKD